MHGWDEEHYARMYFDALKTPPKLNGIIRDQSPVFLLHYLENVPILRLMKTIMVDVGSFVSPCMGCLRQQNGEVLVHEEAGQTHALRLPTS